MPTRKNVPTLSHHRIRRLAVSGGFLDGLCMDFSEGLNCIIGGRGTGKTTVLEFTRYALDRLPAEAGARRRIEALVDHNLEGGRIEVQIETKEGLNYTVSRTAGEAAIVLDEAGKPTEISLKPGNLFSAAIFSQNEVEGIADCPRSQLELLDSFSMDAIDEVNNQLRQVEHDLAANAGAILPLQQAIDGLSDELLTLPGVEDKLKAFAASSSSSSDEINRGHNQKSLRDREKRAVVAMMDWLEEYGANLRDSSGLIERQARGQLSKDVLSSENAAFLKTFGRAMVDCGHEVDKLLIQAAEKIEATHELLIQESSKLHTLHNEQDLAFQRLIEKHKEAQGQASERSRLERHRNDLLAKKQRQDEAKAQLEALQKTRCGLLGRMSELRDKRFALRKEVADRLTRSLSPAIRVAVVQYGNRDEYRARIAAALKESEARLRHSQVAERIAGGMGPVELAENIRARNANALVQSAGLNQEQGEKAMAALSSPNTLFEIEMAELEDMPLIELLDGGTYKKTSALSTGQKCTAILPILLQESTSPLLVDQPEDNLDNGFIYATVVDSIQKVKASRQMILVSHNPNIPVLGDAECVFVMKSDGTSGKMDHAGTVDECKADIVNLLEGGEEAFKRRQKRYKY